MCISGEITMPTQSTREKLRGTTTENIVWGEPFRTTPPTSTLPKSLFCKCKNGTPCFDTMVEIEKYIADALSSQKQQWVNEIKKLADPEVILAKSKKPKYGWSKGTNLYIEALDAVLALIKGEKI